MRKRLAILPDFREASAYRLLYIIIKIMMYKRAAGEKAPLFRPRGDPRFRNEIEEIEQNKTRLQEKDGVRPKKIRIQEKSVWKATVTGNTTLRKYR